MNRVRETRNKPPSTNGISRRRHQGDEPVRLRSTNRERVNRSKKRSDSSGYDDVDGVDDFSGTVRMMPRHREDGHVQEHVSRDLRPVDEVVGFFVPRKPRSVLKRSRENSSSNASVPNKMKANGSKQNPTEGELEIEIAAVLYGLRTQSQFPKEKESDITENAYLSNSEAAPKGRRLVQESEKLGISSTGAVLEFNGPTKTEDLFANLVKKNPITNCESGISSSVTLDFATLETPVKEFPSPSINPRDGEVAVTKVNSSSSEELGLDLMAPPPQMRSSPQRESDVDFVSVAADAEKKTILLPQDKDVNGSRSCRNELLVEEPESKKERLVLESDKSDISMMIKDRSIGLELNLEKDDRENNSESLSANYRSHHNVEMQVKTAKDQYPHKEKTAQFSSLHLPMSVSSWPGGIPTIGYMAPLQGVVPMDGSQVSPTPVKPLFSQPRPKRCGTHCYIARNIHGMQQFMKMNPFWPVMSSMQDKGQGVPVFPGHVAKETTQNQQQILLQHGLPPGTPANMMHGPPAFIFPFNQQQAAAAMAAASVRPGPAPATSSTSASVDGSAAAAPTPAAMCLNYPNMPPSNETQYLALLQNNAYPFPIPAPSFSGTHPQSIPFFYPSQMIHPNMPLQHIQPSKQNPSISNSSSSQKHNIQSQSQPGNGNINGFSSPKTRPPHYSQNYGAVNSTQSLAGNSNGNNIRDENKKQRSEKQNSKPGGVEGSPQTFAMPFSSMNGGSTAHKNNEIFQKLLETDRRTYQVMQAAAVAQAALNKKNNCKVLEEGKNGVGGDSLKIDEQRKGSAPKPLVALANDQVGSRKFVPNSSQLQSMQFEQHHFVAQFQKQQQQMQHQFAAKGNNKAPPTSNGDRLATSSPSTASKLSNTISSYPQNLVQNSTRIASQAQSLSTSSFKNVPQQQQAKVHQQSHTHISFGSGQKSQPVPQRLQPPKGVASPTTSLSKNVAASPRTPSSNSQGNKASSVSSNVKTPSILGSPNNVASSNSSTKSLVHQQQYQQQLKQMANNQPQLFSSPAYMQSQPSQSTSNTANKTSNSTKRSCPAGVQVKPTSEQKQSAGNREPLTRK